MNTHLIIKLGAYDWLDTLNKNRNQIKFKKKTNTKNENVDCKTNWSRCMYFCCITMYVVYGSLTMNISFAVFSYHFDFIVNYV